MDRTEIALDIYKRLIQSWSNGPSITKSFEQLAFELADKFIVEATNQNKAKYIK